MWVRNSGAAQLGILAGVVHVSAVGLGLELDSSLWLLHSNLVPGLEDPSSWDLSSTFLSLGGLATHLPSMGFGDMVDIHMAAQNSKATCLKIESKAGVFHELALDVNSGISVTFIGRGSY